MGMHKSFGKKRRGASPFPYCRHRQPCDPRQIVEDESPGQQDIAALQEC